MLKVLFLSLIALFFFASASYADYTGTSMTHARHDFIDKFHDVCDNDCVITSSKKTVDGKDIYSISFELADIGAGGSATPTPVPPTTPPVTPPSNSAIDLTNWYITLPTGKPGTPDTVKQPTLATFQHPLYFLKLPDGSYRFRAPVTGVTTKNSNYPRSELREMTNGGKDMAKWSSGTGKHQMVFEGTITALPKVKSEVVFGQIHDSEDDICVFRVEGKSLFVNINGKNVKEIDNNFTLGKKVRLGFYTENNVTDFYMNKVKVYTMNKSFSEAYYKVGIYTQSSCEKEGTQFCTPSNFGESVITLLQVTHT